MEPRTLPHDLDAERSVIGAVLINSSMFAVASGIVQPGDFFREAHRHTWECICGLIARETPPDLITLKESLERNRLLDEVGGPAYLASLMDGIPHSANVEYYAHVVKEKAQQRQNIFNGNKLVERAYAEELTAAELARSAIETFATVEAGGAQSGPRPVLVTLSDVRPEAIRWLWPGRIAFGKLTMLSGDPGLGKSFITMDLTARASTGRPWPDGARSVGGAIDVLVLAAEDGLGDTVRPRLDALGADVSRVHVMTGTKERGSERGPRLADVEAIEAAIIETGARLLVIDPVSSYLGVTDSHKDAEVRGLLTPLLTMAERRDCGVLGVMHLTKDAAKAALYRSSGSVAFVAQARVALMVTSDSENPERRVLAASKCNIAKMPDALGYSMHDGRLQWEETPLADFDLDAHLAAASTSAGREGGDRTNAKQVLSDLLADAALWPMDAKDALSTAEDHGISARTLQRTAHQLGIRISRHGFGKGSRVVWNRPLHIDDTIGDTPLDTEAVAPMASMVNQAGKPTNTHIDDIKGAFPRARENGSALRGGGHARY